MDERDRSATNDDDEPIRVLELLAETPSPGFLTKIRSRIHRRLLGNQLAELSWGPISAVFIEFLSSIFESLSGSRKVDRR